MIEYKVLLVEDDEDIANLAARFLNSEGIDVTVAKNGKDALEIFNVTPFRVVITDLHMPEMDGETLVEELRKSEEEPVIIMQTVEHDLERVIDLMKKGIFDYLPKPINKDELLIRVEKAFEHSELLRMKNAASKEREVRLKNQLSWHNWKEQFLHRDRDRSDKNLFSSLRTSFAQGTGFGSLLSLVAIIPELAEKQNGDYILKADLMDLITKNAKQGRKAIDMFLELDQLANTDIKFEEMRIDELLSFIRSIIEEMREKAEIKKQQIRIGDTKIDFLRKVKINKEYFGQVVKEILVNAFKYSDNETTIIILYKIFMNKFVVSFMNIPSEKKGDVVGIPPEYEQIVFEPFFRATKTVDDRYETLDFGLGLTVVEKVIQKHGGMIRAYNIKDYLSDTLKPILRVNIEIEFPVL